MGISKDVALVHFAGIYTGIGPGALYKNLSREMICVSILHLLLWRKNVSWLELWGFSPQKLYIGISRMDAHG